ncbi:MAG: haloacid dehalogenase type II [Acidobacteria bacterium]|nr:haloacid dehalogenase type II [Acidobacteriota bacterium]
MMFDCYGTIIDWETGLTQFLEPILRRYGVKLNREEMLAHYGRLETRVEAGPFTRYTHVLRQVLAAFGREFGFAPRAADLATFARCVGKWPPFPDSRSALLALQTRYRLAILSNVDDDLFAQTAAGLGVTFDHVFTAQQVRAYKPDRRTFHYALQQLRIPPDRILHVAQSLFHDIAPACELGLATVWINRRQGQPGSGATPPAQARPDLELPDLQSLARAAGIGNP